MAHSDVIELALSKVGAKEEPKGSNRGPFVDVITGGNAVPWCALGVCYFFRQCGHVIPGDFAPSKGKMSMTCNVAHLEGIFRKQNWLVAQAQPGDLIFYKGRGLSDTGPGRHVSLCVDVVGNDLISVDCNWSDGVVKRTIRRNDPSIASFGRVPE